MAIPGPQEGRRKSRRGRAGLLRVTRQDVPGLACQDPGKETYWWDLGFIDSEMSWRDGRYTNELGGDAMQPTPDLLGQIGLPLLFGCD